MCQSNHGKKGNKLLKSVIVTYVTFGLKLLETAGYFLCLQQPSTKG
jgi:hypothetical protein